MKHLLLTIKTNKIMITIIKVYIVVENFVKDYKFSDGYVNSVYSSKEKALEACEILSKGDEEYSCHIVERDMSVELSIK